MDLSVVVPAHNEEGNLEQLAREVLGIFQKIGGRSELILVDDGSTDGSFPLLTRLHDMDNRIKILRLKRNYGQTAALAAGMDYASGQVIIPMDGDGQNDPEDIPRLLDKLNDGFDLVTGWRSPRQDPFWSRQLPSRLANGLISWLTEVNLHDYGCTLKAIKKEIAKEIRLYGEMHRFVPAIAFERGARIAEIKVHHRPRRWGKSKYGLTRTFRVILDLLTVKFLMTYGTRPLHVFGPIGFLSGLLGVLLGVYLTVQKLFYRAEIGNRPLLLLVALLIVLGFQFITMGLLGEMLARTYHESQNRPIYAIREILDQRKET